MFLRRDLRDVTRLAFCREHPSCHVEDHLERGERGSGRQLGDYQHPGRWRWRLGPGWWQETNGLTEKILEVEPTRLADGFSMNERKGGITAHCQASGLVSWAGGDAIN